MLFEDGKPLRLGSRAFDILVMFVESAGETVRKDQLIVRAWPDTVVDEGALRVHIGALRKALGDGRAGKRYIANNPGRGYTFVAPVTREHSARHPPRRAERPIANNLPAPLTGIVGRHDTIAAFAAQLARRRLLTIVGPGGIGKTTVAVAVAETVQRVLCRRRMVRRARLVVRSRPGTERPRHRAGDLSVGRQSAYRVGRLAARQAGLDRTRQLRACHRCGGGAGRGCPEGGASGQHFDDEPRALAGRGRSAASPGCAGTSAGFGRSHRRRCAALPRRATVQRARHGGGGRLHLRRCRRAGGSGNLPQARRHAAGTRAGGGARRRLWRARIWRRTSTIGFGS